MNKRRLLKLADLLEADAKNKKGIKFDLSTWGGIEDHTQVLSCGTTACAMGLAVVSGAFKRAGLRGWSEGYPLCPAHGENLGFDAAMSLFDISRDASFFLFADDQYPRQFRQKAIGERYVAKRIRDFVAGKVSPS